jgi:hypothetical protein
MASSFLLLAMTRVGGGLAEAWANAMQNGKWQS